jgi:ubiquinone/menaquinone biosynthesis C-methylase UbiE
MMGSTTGCSLADSRIEVNKRIKATGFDYSKYPTRTVSHCNLCGSTDFELYCHQDRYCLSARSMQCKQCGLIFLSPVMDEKSYEVFYSDWYRKLVAAYSNQKEEEVVDTKAWVMQADVVIKFLAKHMPQMTVNRMLDIGGSTGTFASKIKDTWKCEAVVVDPNKHEIAKAIGKGLTCCCSQFMQYKTDKRFELISMLRTVEHLPDIAKALERVSQLLTSDGMFLLDMINHNWLIRMFKERQVCTKIDHVFQLTDDTMRQYLNKWFPNHKIISSEDTSRVIIYLVVPK